MVVTKRRGRSPELEGWLEERGVSFTFVEALPLEQIDRASSLANQARLEPLSEDVVDRYAADMSRGDDFPPIVVYRRPRARRYILIGGNHRTASADRSGKAELAAYVVDVDGELATRLTYEDNRRHGLPPTEEERMIQAIHLVDCGASQVEAAEIVGLSVGRLQRGLGAQRADRRATELGIRQWPKLPRSVRWRLSSLRSDPVFERTSLLALSASLSARDVYEVVTRLTAARSEAEALALLASEEATHSEKRNTSAGGALRRESARLRMLDSLRCVTALNPTDVVASCATPDHRKVLKDRCVEAARHLQSLHRALGGRGL